MNIFAKHKGIPNSGRLNKEQIERLHESIWTAVAVGEITEQENGNVDGFHADSGLTTEQFQKLKADIFRQCVRQAIANKPVTDQEPTSFNSLIEQLEFPREVETWAAAQLKFYWQMARIESGEIQAENPSGLAMQENEICYITLPATLVEERAVPPTYVAGTSFQFGVRRGQPPPNTDLAIVGQGDFIVTSKRLVFYGNRQVLSTPYARLLDLQVCDDGLDYSSAQWQKGLIVKFSRPEEVEQCGVVISRVLNAQI